MIVILSLVTGLMTGIVFGILKLPIPAPINLAGIAGIFGIYLGYIIIFQYVK